MKTTVTIIMLAIITIAAYLLISSEPEIKIIPQTLTFEIDENPDLIVYEIPKLNPSPEAWLRQSRQSRNDLNVIRDEYTVENEEELREDMKKTEHWSQFINGELTQGYDIIRRNRGDFAEKVPPKRHPTRSRAGIARGFY